MAEYFTTREYACPCCGLALMDTNFLDKLDEIRRRCGFPIYLNSGCRCQRHNKAVGGAAHSAHLCDPDTNLLACAVDIAAYGYHAWCIAHYAFQLGVIGIGWRQHGPQKNRFIHLDDATQIKGIRYRPRIWTYD